MALIIVQCLRHRRYLIMLLSVVQTVAILWLEVCTGKLPEASHLALDRLSVLMILVVTVVGGLICLYAVGYMKRYHIHHAHVQDRVSFFLSMLFVFLGAMCGLVLSENLNWLYFFWEITSVVSFLLIGYTKAEDAVKNSFRALWMNLLGGAGFCGGIIDAAVAYFVRRGNSAGFASASDDFVKHFLKGRADGFSQHENEKSHHITLPQKPLL